MKGLLRRLRGIIGTGLTWAVGWMGLIGLVVFPVLALLGNPIFSNIGLYLTNVFIVGVGGFIAGGGFAVVLGVLERHKKLEDLSSWRMGIWGALGGLVFAAALVEVSPLSLIISAVLGAGSAAGSLALAKRAKDPDQIEGNDEPLPALEGE